MIKNDKKSDEKEQKLKKKKESSFKFKTEAKFRFEIMKYLVNIYPKKITMKKYYVHCFKYRCIILIYSILRFF